MGGRMRGGAGPDGLIDKLAAVWCDPRHGSSRHSCAGQNRLRWPTVEKFAREAVGPLVKRPEVVLPAAELNGALAKAGDAGFVARV